MYRTLPTTCMSLLAGLGLLVHTSGISAEESSPSSDNLLENKNIQITQETERFLTLRLTEPAALGKPFVCIYSVNSERGGKDTEAAITSMNETRKRYEQHFGTENEQKICPGDAATGLAAGRAVAIFEASGQGAYDILTEAPPPGNLFMLQAFVRVKQTPANVKLYGELLQILPKLTSTSCSTSDSQGETLVLTHQTGQCDDEWTLAQTKYQGLLQDVGQDALQKAGIFSFTHERLSLKAAKLRAPLNQLQTQLGVVDGDKDYEKRLRDECTPPCTLPPVNPSAVQVVTLKNDLQNDVGDLLTALKGLEGKELKVKDPKMTAYVVTKEKLEALTVQYNWSTPNAILIATGLPEPLFQVDWAAARETYAKEAQTIVLLNSAANAVQRLRLKQAVLATANAREAVAATQRQLENEWERIGTVQSVFAKISHRKNRRFTTVNTGMLYVPASRELIVPIMYSICPWGCIQDGRGHWFSKDDRLSMLSIDLGVPVKNLAFEGSDREEKATFSMTAGISLTAVRFLRLSLGFMPYWQPTEDAGAALKSTIVVNRYAGLTVDVIQGAELMNLFGVRFDDKYKLTSSIPVTEGSGN